MSYKDNLEKTVRAKIRQARLDLSIGWHNPELLDEIHKLMSLIKLVQNFETKLMSDNFDID